MSISPTYCFRSRFRRALIAAVVVVATWLPFATSVLAADVKLISGELDKFISKKDGKLVGLFADIFNLAAGRAKVTIEIRLVPWKRATVEAQRRNDVLVFPLTRNTMREPKYSWQTPLFTDEIAFYSLARAVNSLEEAANLRQIVVWPATSQEAWLKAKGLTNIVSVADTNRARRLITESPNSTYFGPPAVTRAVLGLKLGGKSVVRGKTIYSETTWLAGGVDFQVTPEVRRFLQAVDALRENGELRRLHALHIVGSGVE